MDNNASVVHSLSANNSNATETEEEIIQRLATLSKLQYAKIRKSVAEQLGINVNWLDRAVKSEHENKKSNSNLLFTEEKLWDKAVNGDDLLNDIVHLIHRIVVCEQSTAEAAALWITFTWCIDAVSIAPIANITAPMPNCGKSTMLDLMEKLVKRPLKTDNISNAALFRTIDKYHPTLLIDEVDAFLKNNEDARGIINSSHKRNGFILRTDGDNHEPKGFFTWGAIALCGIGSIAKTLQSRSIKIELRRKLEGENTESIRHINQQELEILRSKLARFSMDNIENISQSRPVPPAGLNNRAQDNWEPLFAIADAAGGDWSSRARIAAIKNTETDDVTIDINIELLGDIRKVFTEKCVNKISTADLLEALCEDDLSPWPTWNNGKPITPRQLSVFLKKFKIKPCDIRTDSSDERYSSPVRKGYLLEKFKDAFSRYLPNP